MSVRQMYIKGHGLMCEHVSLNNIIRMRTLIVSLLLLVLLLDIFAVGDDIDRTFNLFKKKKEKIKDKLKKDKDKKKPSYKPVIARTFRKKNKNKDKKKPKPSYKPSYHPPAVLSYNTPSYHGKLFNQYTTRYKSLIPQPPVTPGTAPPCLTPSVCPDTSGPQWWVLTTPGPSPRNLDPSDIATTSHSDYLILL